MVSKSEAPKAPAAGPRARPRAPEAREAKQRLILEAAAKLLRETGFHPGGIEGVGLNAIARAARMTKSNVYRYFESREQILLELLVRDEAEWVQELERQLVPLSGSNDTRGVARVVATSLAAYPRLCQLTSVVSGVLEQNVSAEAALRFKQAVQALSTRIGNALFVALPALPYSELARVQRYVHAIVAGLWPMAHPAAPVAEVLARPELAHFQVDFAADLEGSIAALLAGVLPRG